MNANLALIIEDARNNDLGDLTDTEVLIHIADTVDPADLVGTTDPVGLAYLAFLTDLTHLSAPFGPVARPRQWQVVAESGEVVVAGPLTHPRASLEFTRLTEQGRPVRLAFIK